MIKNLFSKVDNLLSREGKFGVLLTDLVNGMISPWGSKNNPLIDPTTEASVAGVFTPTYLITVVSGALAITGITVPYPDFQGYIILLPTGAFTWTTATNIAVAGTAVVGRALFFVYNPITAKWYPSYV